MPAESLRAAPKPDPAHVKVQDRPDPSTRGAWCIELSMEATVIELAILMARFKCRAEVMTDETLRLLPNDPWAPRPTGEQIIELFEKGLEGAGSIHPVRIRFAPDVAPVIEVDIVSVCTCGAPGGYPHEPDCAWWISSGR